MNNPQLNTNNHTSYLDGDELDLAQYLKTLSAHKWAIMGFSVFVTLLTTLFVYSMDSFYQATLTMLIESEEENVVSIDEVYGIPGAIDQYFETQNQILRSRSLAEKVIDKLNITKHPDFDPDLQKPGMLHTALSWLPMGNKLDNAIPAPDYVIRNNIVGKFRNRLKVSPVRNSQLINITFESKDPKLSSAVPNTLANIYINSHLEGRLAITEKATGTLTEKITGLKQKLEESERILQNYRDKEKLIDIRGVDSLAAKELDEITVELVTARRNRIEAETVYQQVTALKGQPLETFESIPAVLSDAGLQNAKRIRSELELKISEFEERYGPKFPAMISAKSELEAARKDVHGHILKVIDSIKKQYEVARANENDLISQMNRTKRDIGELNRKGGKLQTLEREVEGNRKIYETFLSRFKETSAVSDIEPVHARIIDPAMLPSSPAKPKKKLIILIAFLLSLIMGMMIALMIEALDNTMENGKDVEEKLHIPLLGILPKLNIWLDKDVKMLRYYTDNNHTPFAENIRTIRSGLLLTGLDDKQKVILVTSSVPGEGKSMTVVNLSLALAQMGKILLIDCDLRRPSINNVFGLDSNAIGLSHFMQGTYTLEQVIHSFSNGRVNIIPAGVIPPNPLEMLSAQRFSKSLELLKKEFDHIVIDSAPAVSVSDAVVMSQLVNQVVYLIKADETPYQLAQEGISRLQKVGAPIVGAVLNQVAPPKKSSYGYYGYYGYGAGK